MEIVALKVRVDRSEFTNLQNDVNNLQNRTINIQATADTQTAAKNLNTYSKAAKAAGQESETLMHKVSKFAEWYVIGNVVSGVVRAFGNALETMKAVDSELVTVRKVTGATAEEMEKIEKQAYATASAYGVAADAYLQSVAEFARAGYEDQSEALAELATKTQIVGDTNAETANQFLLSVDAAYKYNGEISKLSAVLDGANEIDNKYATSIEKIAEGLGKVAPIASQAHVGVDELTAAIGTITAVTQRSGTEASTALRALFLNIIGDTKTEIDEGVTWTTGEIAGLRDVIKLYAKDAYEAAEATGSVINPMEAIAGLAQSMEDGLLTEQKLMEMVSDIGGKLRTSQLLALIQNWDMYKSMVEDFGGAMGSADKEVQNAMNSWERKTAQLSNAWTEMITNLVDTELIKGGLDLIIGAVELLDTDAGRLVITVGALTAATLLLGAAKDKVLATSAAQTAGAWISTLKSMTGSVAELKAGFALLSETMLASPLFWVVAGTALVAGITAIADKIFVTAEEQKQITEEINAELSKTEQQLIALQNKGEELTDAERDKLIILQAQTEELKKQAKESSQLALDKEWNSTNVAVDMTVDNMDMGQNDGAGTMWITQTQHMGMLVDEYRELQAVRAENGRLSATELERESELTTQFAKAAESLLAYKEAGAELTPEMEALYAALVNILGTDVADELDNSANSIDNLENSAKQAVNTIDQLKATVETISAALEEFKEYGGLTRETVEELESTFPGLTAALYDANGELTETGRQALSSASALIELAKQCSNVTVAGQQMSFAAAVAELNKLRNAAAGAATTLIMTDAVMQYKGDLEAAVAAASAAFSQLDGLDFSSGGGGGGAGKVTNEYEKQVDLLKSELDLLEAQEAPVGDRIYKMRQIQDALHAEAEYLRRIGAEQSDINALSKEWWSIQKDIEALQQSLVDELEQAVDLMLEQAREAADKAIEAIDKEIEALKEARDTKKEQLTLEEKILAVQEAQAALANAQAERTVRYYNATTGQWEWAANAQNVKNAQEALEDAEKDLQEYREELAYQAAIKELEAKKEAINEAYEALEEEWDAIIDSLQEPSRAIGDILNDIATVGAPQMQAQIENVNTMLGKLNEYIANATGSTVSGSGASGALGSVLGSAGGGYGSGGKFSYDLSEHDWENDTTDYSEKMMNSTSWEEFDHWATMRKYKAEAQGIDISGSNSNEKLYWEWSANQPDGWGDPLHSYQQGVILGTVGSTALDNLLTQTPHVGITDINNAEGYLNHHELNALQSYHALSSGKDPSTDTSLYGSGQLTAQEVIDLAEKYNYQLFDSGGVLKGLGGIKATKEDEMILPPELTRNMLSPSADGVFRQRMDELRYLYGETEKAPQSLAGELTSKQTNDHYGDEYTFGDVTLTEQQAKGMTVYELAQMSRTLGIHKNV